MFYFQIQLGEEWNVTACERCKCEKGYNIVCQITSCADCSPVCHCFFSSHLDVFFLCITEWSCFTRIFTKKIKCTTIKFWRGCLSRQLWYSWCQPYLILFFRRVTEMFPFLANVVISAVSKEYSLKYPLQGIQRTSINHFFFRHIDKMKMFVLEEISKNIFFLILELKPRAN